MDTIKEIIHIYGFESVDEMTYDDHIKLELDCFDPLVIEKVGPRRVSVAHYYEQNGDLMRSPEIVFKVTDDGNWVAIEYQDDSDGYRRDENGLEDVTAFALSTWDDNLREQGFIEAAEQAASSPSSSHEVTA
jgi:hypothetical protein